MSCYKFLARGALGPISGFRWPTPQGEAPGAWIEVAGSLEPCLRGVHVCRPTDLSFWIHDELWQTEADGDSIEGFDCLVVRRARLVRRFAIWQDGAAQRFAEACAEHAAGLVASGVDLAAVSGLPAAVSGLINDAQLCARSGYPACGAFSAALAVAKFAGAADAKAAFRRERAWQADWISRSVIGA